MGSVALSLREASTSPNRSDPVMAFLDIMAIVKIDRVDLLPPCSTYWCFTTTWDTWVGGIT